MFKRVDGEFCLGSLIGTRLRLYREDQSARPGIGMASDRLVHLDRILLRVYLLPTTPTTTLQSIEFPNANAAIGFGTDHDVVQQL